MSDARRRHHDNIIGQARTILADMTVQDVNHDALAYIQTHLLVVIAERLGEQPDLVPLTRRLETVAEAIHALTGMLANRPQQ